MAFEHVDVLDMPIQVGDIVAVSKNITGGYGSTIVIGEVIKLTSKNVTYKVVARSKRIPYTTIGTKYSTDPQNMLVVIPREDNDDRN